MEIIGINKEDSWKDKEVVLTCACCGNRYKAKKSELSMINDAKSPYYYTWSCSNCNLLNKY